MDLINALSDLCKSTKQPIIAIDGPAGAGKTILAHNLKLALSKSFRVGELHIDDLSDGWDHALSSQLTDTLTHITECHKSSSPLSLSRYDWATSEFSKATPIDACELLILEGVGSGQSAIREQLSALIWIDIAGDQGLTRVLARDGIELENEMRKWLITQEQHFQGEGTQNAADFLLTT